MEVFYASCLVQTWMQHCWPTTHNIAGCYMLRPFARHVACCCMLLRVVPQSLKRFKILSQQLPRFLLFCDRRSVAQQCWIRLHSSSNMGPRTRITHGLQSLMGCILPTMHCRSQQCLELFAHHSPTLSQQLPILSGEQYWELLCSFARSFCAMH